MAANQWDIDRSWSTHVLGESLHDSRGFEGPLKCFIRIMSQSRYVLTVLKSRRAMMLAPELLATLTRKPDASMLVSGR
ncbi:hypothetical protein PG984_012354 [Apiospora sp. TS-2023a]